MSDFLDRLLAQSRPAPDRPAVAPRLPGRFEGQAGEGFEEVEDFRSSAAPADMANAHPAPVPPTRVEAPTPHLIQTPTLESAPPRAPAPVERRTEYVPTPFVAGQPLRSVAPEPPVPARADRAETSFLQSAAPPLTIAPGPTDAVKSAPLVERRNERVEHVVETRSEAPPVAPPPRAPEPLVPEPLVPAPLAPVLLAAVAPPTARPEPTPPPAPVVRVHIGRIEIQAAADAFADMRRPAREVAPPAPSALERHLRGG